MRSKARRNLLDRSCLLATVVAKYPALKYAVFRCTAWVKEQTRTTLTFHKGSDSDSRLRRDLDTKLRCVGNLGLRGSQRSGGSPKVMGYFLCNKANDTESIQALLNTLVQMVVSMSLPLGSPHGFRGPFELLVLGTGS